MNTIALATLLVGSAVTVSVAVPTPLAADALALKDCVAAYEGAFEVNDVAGCVALWRANPHWTAVALASDVETAFAERETGRGEDEIQPRLRRVLWGSRCALEAGQPLVADYAASLVGLDEAARTLYRQAQRIHERATSEHEAGEHDLAVTVAREVVERTIDLGDWWGAATGYVTLAECHRALGAHEDALVAYGQARNLFHGLGLVQSELDALVGMATAANAIERYVRARELARAGLAAADRMTALVEDFDDRAPRRELLRLLAGLEARLGDEEAAGEARRALEALQPR